MTPQGQIIVAVKRAAKEKYAWAGGYPLYILLATGEPLCCDCAAKNLGRIAESTHQNQKYDDGWKAACVDINYEDTNMWCCHCHLSIDSAYGE